MKKKIAKHVAKEIRLLLKVKRKIGLVTSLSYMHAHVDRVIRKKSEFNYIALTLNLIILPLPCPFSHLCSLDLIDRNHGRYCPQQWVGRYSSPD